LVFLSHGTLNFNRSTDRVYDAAKFDQQAIAHCLDDATALRSERGIDQFITDTLQARQRAFLVGPDKAAVTNDVSRQYRRKPSLDSLFGHDDLSLSNG
jgi:hypothetical protein